MGPRDRHSRHRPAVVAAALPRVLDQTLSPAHLRSPARQRRGQSPVQAKGRGESTLERPANPCRAPQARHRCHRTYGLPADAQAWSPVVTDLAEVASKTKMAIAPSALIPYGPPDAALSACRASHGYCYRQLAAQCSTLARPLAVTRGHVASVAPRVAARLRQRVETRERRHAATYSWGRR
jgi:hypothetical protein